MQIRAVIFGVAAMVSPVGVPAVAWAQDAGAAAVDPTPVVTAARGATAALFERTVRYRGAAPQETTLAIPTTRGGCYTVLGHATGAAQVTVQVMAHEAEVGPGITLANSTGQAARGRFCAVMGGQVYSLRVRTEGPAWWSVALVTAAPTSPTGTGGATVEGTTDGGQAAPLLLAVPRDAGASTSASTSASATAHPPIGGTEQDYVGAQLRAFGARHPGLVALTPAVRRALATNETYQTPLTLASGHCVDVVVAGVPSVGDLVIELEDPTGNRVAQDDTHQTTESVHYCPSYGGAYRLRVRMFVGMGLVAIQALTEP